MARKKVLTEWSAERVRDNFPEFPQTRVDQISLYQTVYFGAQNLRGKPLSQCSDKQIRAVAHFLYDKSFGMQKFSERKKFIEQAGNDYHFDLARRLNVSSLDYSTSELEKMMGID